MRLSFLQSDCPVTSIDLPKAWRENSRNTVEAWYSHGQRYHMYLFRLSLYTVNTTFHRYRRLSTNLEKKYRTTNWQPNHSASLAFHQPFLMPVNRTMRKRRRNMPAINSHSLYDLFRASLLYRIDFRLKTRLSFRVCWLFSINRSMRVSRSIKRLMLRPSTDFMSSTCAIKAVIF